MPKVITDHLLCHRETSRIREGKAVVHHSYQESDARAKFCHRKSHMAASENNQALFREKWFRHIPTASGAPTDRLPLRQGFFSNLRCLCSFLQLTAHICEISLFSHKASLQRQTRRPFQFFQNLPIQIHITHFLSFILHEPSISHFAVVPSRLLPHRPSLARLFTKTAVRENTGWTI